MNDVSISVQQCQSCGRVLTFHHSETNLLQCVCGAVVNRKEGGILINKPFYIIQNPSDFIQPGTEGSWNGKSFHVLGRFRVWTGENIFNYWTIVFEDGQLAYLVEGYGLFAIYEKTALDNFLPAGELLNLSIGTTRELFSNKYFLLERKDKCTKWEIEGEVYMPESNSGFNLYDFAYANGSRIELIQYLNNYTVAYKVYPTTLNDLQLVKLRETENGYKKITCSKCSTENEINKTPYLQSFVCMQCGQRYILKEGMEWTQLAGHNQADITPDIALGSKGSINGILYEVIGYMVKEEKNIYRSQWKEYTLYNQKNGFAYLSEFEGHWIFIKETMNAPVLFRPNAKEFEFKNEPFQLYNEYNYKTIQSLGAFPFNIADDDDKNVKEFISPPEVWIMERNKKEGIVWFLGEHITGNELERAFDKINLPYKTGVGAIEPTGFINLNQIIFATIISALLLIILHVSSSSSKQEQLLLSEDVQFPDSTNQVSILKSNLQLDKRESNLEIKVSAPVDNSWFELNATLTNTKTGDEYALAKGVEYYYGVSEGESWSEGSKNETAYLSRIPAGNYVLKIDGIRDSGSGFIAYNYSRPNSFMVQVLYDTPNHRNLIVCLILLLIWPVYKYYHIQNSEKKRWANSPFSPFSYED